ncbi:MAG: serine/threonine protein kinase [Planctomycetes bacterium]|nr:serine/threonine protein kinase [Planctomycetota bacterium]
MQCPYCDAKLDDVAILTNVCSACHEVLGDISQTMRTLRLDHPAPLSELEIKASGSDAKTVISLPTNDDGATVFVDDFATEPMPQPTARVLTSRTFVSQSGEATDYEIINKIGEGGMGIVQQARQNSLNRIVAIKIMGGYKGVDAESHFMQEATVTGSLEHPNIVPIYDMGRNEDGQPFYTMKRINGTPWAKTLLEKGLMDNIEILLRICDAVAYAHSRGIIHRDIKPENVMIGEFGETLLMDWGLAAGMWDGAAAPRVRYEDAIAGTPAYMAPEMAKGEEDNIGFHSDIYLLGAVLYEIITFEQPHNGGSVRECLDNAAANRIVPPFLGEGDKEPAMLQIARKAMATSPADRFASVHELQEAIRTSFSSIKLSTRANHARKRAHNDHSYLDFFRALGGYSEALETWNGNEDAKRSLELLSHEFAEEAIKNGDLHLAELLLKRDNPNDSVLLRRIDELRSPK